MHPHYESMKLYLQDAAETRTPWERWQFRYHGNADEWFQCDDDPTWAAHKVYRRKPEMIRIGGVEVPEPLRKVPLVGEVWVPVINSPISFTPVRISENYPNGELDFLLRRGLLHESSAAAEAHARALIALTGAI